MQKPFSPARPDWGNLRDTAGLGNARVLYMTNI